MKLPTEIEIQTAVECSTIFVKEIWKTTQCEHALLISKNSLVKLKILVCIHPTQMLDKKKRVAGMERAASI